MIDFEFSVKEQEGKTLTFSPLEFLSGMREKEAHPRNEAEAAAYLHETATHGHFAVYIDSVLHEEVSLLQRALLGRWKDMTVIIKGMRVEMKHTRLPNGAVHVDVVNKTVFKAVTLEKVGVTRSAFDSEGYTFSFRVWGSSKEEDAEE